MPKTKKSKNNSWYKKIRGSYLPVSWQGWISYIPYITFLIGSYIYVENHSSSITEIIVGVFPYWVSAAVVMNWFASQNSK